MTAPEDRRMADLKLYLFDDRTARQDTQLGVKRRLWRFLDSDDGELKGRFQFRMSYVALLVP